MAGSEKVDKVENRSQQYFKFRQKCSLANIFDKITSRGAHDEVGRGMGCELHIDGDFIFLSLAALGLALGFLTFQAITAAGGKKKREAQTTIMDLALSGI